MKILMFIKKWGGGIKTVVESVSRELELKGHEVEVISREEDLKCFSTIKAFFKSRKAVAEKDYDILYSQDWSCALLNMLKRRHYVCFHGNDPNFIGRLIQTIIGRMMGNKLIVVGPTLKKRFPKSNLIHNGVDTKKFRPLRKKRTYLGWMDKGTETLNKEGMEKLCKGLKTPLLIAEKIPHEKMNDFYNQCKIFISLPPESAGFNLCWVEAMASGVPVVIGNKEGIGSQLPINKIEDFKDIKDAVINSKEKNYKKFIEKEFMWDNHVKKLIKLWIN
jgi:glycosyltransferase involved in cell wall biosynthesis